MLLSGRQPAEGGAREVAGGRRGPARDRRAHARHRRRGQGRDLRADEPAHREGRGHPDDLVGAARGAGHERPHPGDAPGPDRGRARRARARPRSRCCARRWGRPRERGALARAPGPPGRDARGARAALGPALDPEPALPERLQPAQRARADGDQRRDRGRDDVRDRLGRHRPVGGLDRRVLRRGARERAPGGAAGPARGRRRPRRRVPSAAC